MLLQELEIIFSFDALDNTRLGKDALARVNVFAIADVKSNVFEIVFWMCPKMEIKIYLMGRG